MSRFGSGDGPSNAVSRLHRGLLDLGIDSKIFVAEKRSAMDDPTVTAFQPPMDVPSRLRRRVRRAWLASSLARYQSSRPAGYEAFSDDRTVHGAAPWTQLPSCDLVNVHAMYHFVDYETFFATVPRRVPVVRTLHDMNFFTGGCHIAAGCVRYLEQCGTCPQLGSRRQDDLSRQVWRRKAAALSGVDRDRLHIVAPSRWLANEARRSSLLRGFRISVIPFGVDTGVFGPRDKSVARETLGVPRAARVILFVAEPITRPVKRIGVLAEALTALGGLRDVVLITVGSGHPESKIPVAYLNLGRIGNERLLSLVYSAADVLVLPSLQENFPLVALEAMACGTPVIGSAVGGLLDLIRPGTTGQVFPVEDVTALRASIIEMLRDPIRLAAMSVTCRRVAVDEYSLQIQARRYAQLYETILAGREPPEDFSGPVRGEARPLEIGAGPVE